MALSGFAQVSAQNLVSIDASTPAQMPKPVAATLGTAHDPQGDVIGVNSQYLTYNGKPWLPVMGEFHYSRYPEAEWEPEILKMKAAGVQIVSTYVIWIHHEQNENVWDWSDQRDLRKFAELCGKHGMYLYPRIGPWAHAETRNGGLPDWVLKNSPVRQDDPIYLREVGDFYAQIGEQLHGLLWKDGGPVIGVQIENEYHDQGPGKGVEHIRTLKRMAVEAGLDVPLYTVTGWDGAAVPLDTVLPVFGGYPDAPWSGAATKLPPNEVYAFRFGNRAAGSMGAMGDSGQNPAANYEGTPFMTAEVGDGIEDTYFRRPVVSADDVAAILPVMLGSGANLLGYYMFHGGRNPDGGALTLQESKRTGYPTDVPDKSYDFQAPLGEYGQERESLRKLKLVNYFLNDFGALLAPMSPHAPDRVPADPADMGPSRVSVRTSGDAGFIFLNNKVRGQQMPDRKRFQVELKLPSCVVRVPEKPIDLPAGSYGIWPVNLVLPGVTLRYSTAQLFKRIAVGDQTYYFFFTIPGVAPEFAFDAGTKIGRSIGKVGESRSVDVLRLQMRADTEGEIQLAEGVHLALLPESQAEQIWRVDDPSLMLTSRADVFSDGNQWTLLSEGEPEIDFGVFGARAVPKSETALTRVGGDGLFERYRTQLPEVRVQPKLTQLHAAAVQPPWNYGPDLTGQGSAIPFAPEDADFGDAAAWKIEVPPISSQGSLSDAFLVIHYQGDVARLYHGEKLVDDNFWNGIPWSVGLREVDVDWRRIESEFELRVLPLPKDYPMYIEQADQLRFGSKGAAAALIRVEIVPQYQLVLEGPRSGGTR
jgi:hypothetical protein